MLTKLLYLNIVQIYKSLYYIGCKIYRYVAPTNLTLFYSRAASAYLQCVIRGKSQEAFRKQLTNLGLIYLYLLLYNYKPRGQENETINNIILIDINNYSNALIIAGTVLDILLAQQAVKAFADAVYKNPISKIVQINLEKLKSNIASLFNYILKGTCNLLAQLARY